MLGMNIEKQTSDFKQHCHSNLTKKKIITKLAKLPKKKLMIPNFIRKPSLLSQVNLIELYI